MIKSMVLSKINVSCLTNLQVFMEEVSWFPVDVVYLDFQNDFDNVPHRRLISATNPDCCGIVASSNGWNLARSTWAKTLPGMESSVIGLYSCYSLLRGLCLCTTWRGSRPSSRRECGLFSRHEWRGSVGLSQLEWWHTSTVRRLFHQNPVHGCCVVLLYCIVLCCVVLTCIVQ